MSTPPTPDVRPPHAAPERPRSRRRARPSPTPTPLNFGTSPRDTPKTRRATRRLVAKPAQSCCGRVLSRHSLACRLPGVRTTARAEAKRTSTTPDARVAATAANQNGQVTIHQLRAAGLSDDAVAARVRAGRLHRRHRGVYSVGWIPQTPVARCSAAVLACGRGAALAGHAAAAHLGIARWDDRDPEVVVPASRRPRVRGVRVRRARNLDRRDIVRHDGIWVTTPARTLLDLAASVGARVLRRLVRQAQVERRTNLRQLHDMLARANGHRGVAALRAAIADGAPPTRSDLEDVVLDLLAEATSERPAVNKPLRLDGERIIPDFLWPDRKLVIEADSRRYHDAPVVRAEDARRQAILEAHGYAVLRIDEAALLTRGRTVARVRAALERTGPPQPCAQPAAHVRAPSKRDARCWVRPSNDPAG